MTRAHVWKASEKRLMHLTDRFDALQTRLDSGAAPTGGGGGLTVTQVQDIVRSMLARHAGAPGSPGGSSDSGFTGLEQRLAHDELMAVQERTESLKKEISALRSEVSHAVEDAASDTESRIGDLERLVKTQQTNQLVRELEDRLHDVERQMRKQRNENENMGDETRRRQENQDLLTPPILPRLTIHGGWS